MKKLSILFALLLIITQSANAQRYGGYRDEDQSKFRIGVHGGWSYRTAPISKDASADLRTYLKGLKSGYNYGANAVFFFNNAIGAGIEYSGFRVQNESTVSAIDTTTFKVVNGVIKDDITVTFIGPSISSRYILGANDNIHIVGTASIGYLSYKDDAMFFDSYTVKAGTVGALVKFSFDFAIAQSVFLGAEIGYLGGSLSKFNYEDATGSKTIELEEGHAENVSRLDFSGGLRLNF